MVDEVHLKARRGSILLIGYPYMQPDSDIFGVYIRLVFVLQILDNAALCCLMHAR